MQSDHLGHLIQQLRLARGIQQKELAELAKVSRRTAGTAESSEAGTLKNSTLQRIIIGLALSSPITAEEKKQLVEAGITEQAIDTANNQASIHRDRGGDADDAHRNVQDRFRMAVRLLTRHGIDREGLIILEALAEQAVARSASGRRDTDDGRRIYTVDGPPITMADGSPAQSATEYEFQDEGE